MSKKKQRNLYKTSPSSDMEYSKVIKIAIGVILVLMLTYLVTAILSGEIKFGNKEVKEEVSIQYEEIIAGQILNRPEDEYYVLLFSFTDKLASNYLSLKDTYIEENNKVPFYIVDTDKQPNQMVLALNSEQEKINVNNVNDLKVTVPIIIKVKDHKVVESVKGLSDVVKFFKQDN